MSPRRTKTPVHAPVDFASFVRQLRAGQILRQTVAETTRDSLRRQQMGHGKSRSELMISGPKRATVICEMTSCGRCCAALVIAICAGVVVAGKVKVQTQYDKKFDFSRLHTYAWH